MTGWNDERTEVLKKLWIDGCSASEIAKRLGGVTRNAVIGKAHRLGYVRVAAAKPARVAEPKARLIVKAPKLAAKPKLPPAQPLRPVRCRDEAPGLATILTLASHMCRWPIGDPALPNFTFCGRRKDEGSYCADHAQRAHQAAEVKKKTTPANLARSLRRYIA